MILPDVRLWEAAQSRPVNGVLVARERVPVDGESRFEFLGRRRARTVDGVAAPAFARRRLPRGFAYRPLANADPLNQTAGLSHGAAVSLPIKSSYLIVQDCSKQFRDAALESSN